MADRRDIDMLIEHYGYAGAPSDQQMLIMLLKEVQAEEGGTISQAALSQICEAYSIKPVVLIALIRRIPALRSEDVPHKLEICATCKSSAALRDYIESEFGLKSGSSSQAAGFMYRTVNCMKNCKNGPSIRWDGVLYSNGTIELIKQLTGKM